MGVNDLSEMFIKQTGIEVPEDKKEDFNNFISKIRTAWMQEAIRDYSTDILFGFDYLPLMSELPLDEDERVMLFEYFEEISALQQASLRLYKKVHEDALDGDFEGVAGVTEGVVS